MNLAAQLRRIDLKIDLNRAELVSRGTIFDSECFLCWGLAWGQSPALKARDRSLFVERATIRSAQDAQAEKDYQREQRRLRAQERRTTLAPCPTCGSNALLVAA